jgi:hypothetical protein
MRHEMNLIDLLTMTPLSEAELRQRNPNVSFPAVLTQADVAAFNVAVLVNTPSPNDEYSSYEPGTPTQNADGSYTQAWTTTDLPLDQCQQILLAKLAAYRWTISYAPVVYNTIQISTDTQAFTVLRESVTNNLTINFKGLNGWISLAPTDSSAILNTMTAQIQNAFTNERKHHDAIMALTLVSDVRTYDFTTGW